MRLRPRRALFVAIALVATRANALETPPVGGEPIRLDVTEATSVFYDVDNRNSRAGVTATRLDDDWGVWYNRLNTQASWKNFQVGLRLDSAWFYTAPNPTGTALTLLDERRTNPGAAYSPTDAQFFVQKTQEASRELATRYTSWLYPSKYYVGYTQRDVEATLGDFYAQFGRGLVLSVRKLDELASDTTIRGARITTRFRSGDFRLRVTVLGGVLNPLRLDEASGRYLGVTGAVTPGLVSLAEGGMPRAIASPFEDGAEPTYAPDRVAAVELEGGTRVVQVGLHGSLIDRTFLDVDGVPTALSPGAVRSADALRTGSLSVNLPDLEGHGAAYVEAAVQNLGYPAAIASSSSELPDTGYALYANVTLEERPVTLTVEAKHYRRFFPLVANVDLARAPEFSVVQYNAPPTTEGVWVDTEFEGFNTCVSGGRAKADVKVGPHANVFAWVGRYLTWAESVANEQCHTGSDNLNRVWDFASGLEVVSQDRRSRVTATLGTRFDDTARLIPDPNGGDTNVFYRELYGRYEATEWLGGPFTLRLQGWDRRRHQTLGGVTTPWTELQQLVALDYAPRLTVGAGFEYTGNPQFPPTYFNGMLGYNISSSSNVSLFAGQRRGGLRCVSGVCRVYPPFEGVRVDATFRF
ncbi:MAG TPA: DUF6029 family protein [Polyangiaceae bacterium]|jgi:hypothetical protein|nr:DUF6029 family protein [Polyangiaceae bacterium]